MDFFTQLSHNKQCELGNIHRPWSNNLTSSSVHIGTAHSLVLAQLFEWTGTDPAEN